MRAAIALLVLLTVLAAGVGADARAATGDAKAGEKKAQLCLTCHRPGNELALVPLLAAQPAGYLYDQMKAYKEKRRLDETMSMQTNTANLSDRDMRDIAQYFSVQPAGRDTHKVDAQKAAAGKAKAEAANCAACHSTKGKHQNVPSISGQRPFYLVKQLEAFGSGKRAHGSGPMAAPPLKLSAEEAESLAHYYAQAE